MAISLREAGNGTYRSVARRFPAKTLSPSEVVNGLQTAMRAPMNPVRLLASLSLGLSAASVLAVTPADQLKVPDGFKVELLKEAGQRDGSWICMTADDAGRLYISPQGSIPETGFAKDSKWGGLVRATVSDKGVEKWERVPVPVGDAMGMLWAFDSLYVSGNGPEGRGIYRCKDTNGDGLPDAATMWKKIPGGAGEHGAHALVLGPDKKSIYVVNGNSTGIVDALAPESPYRNWGEDDLLPRVKDPVATFFDKVKAPYGCVYKTDENGSKWELYAGGFRNPYDIDFNADGELFTYDSDMEWDRGLPWYRPTRILHVVPGGEYGFREGTSKWPDWYPDSLPPVCDIGVGCPTGVKFGTNAKGWPAQYRGAFFICDWTYGRLLAVHLHEKGASYTAENPIKSYWFPKDAEASKDVEVFLSGKGMPITDVEFGKDGAMYLTVGGRGTAAGLYRVSPTTKSAEPVAAPAGKDYGDEVPPKIARDTAKMFLSGQKPKSDEKMAYGIAIVKLVPKLDPVISLAIWKNLEQKALEGKIEELFENKPMALQILKLEGMTMEEVQWFRRLEGTLAAARVEPGGVQERIFNTLKEMPLAKLPDPLKIFKLRTIELSFARQGRCSQEWIKTGMEKLLASYPASSADRSSEMQWRLNRELCQLLIWMSNPELGDLNEGATAGDRGSASQPVPNPGSATHPGRKGADFQAEMGRQIIDKTLALLDAAASQEEQIYYVMCLRWGYGWTPEQRAHYFRWFREKATRYNGGNSFAKFLDKIREDAASRVPESERAALAELLGPAAAPKKVEPVKPRDFVKAWTLDDVQAALAGLKDRQPNVAHGKELFAAAQCANCHLFRDTGGNVGPDLTAVAQRFGRKDILEAIIDPNKVVSDQYAMITLTVQKFGGGGTDQVSGLVKEESSGAITLLTDPLAGKTSTFYENVIVKREKANVSIMPPGLLNTLTAEEVADLLAFLGNMR